MKVVKQILAALGKLLDSKVVVVILLVVAGLFVFQSYRCGKSNGNEALDIYKRQLSGQLTEKERELESAHHELGVLKSELVSRDELEKRLQKDKEELDQAFEAFKRQHGLIIASRDKEIAELKQHISDGKVDVVVGSQEDTCLAENLRKCNISYKWQDVYGRFKLTDDNIFDSKAEFTAHQIFKVYGEVWSQSDGSLQTRRVVLREVHRKDDGTYEDIPDAKAEIVESSFEYHNPPALQTEWSWRQLFTLRPIVMGHMNFYPYINTELGAGIEILNIYGVGLNSTTYFNFTNPELIGQSLGLSYSPTFFDRPLNFGVGISVGTPFLQFGQAWSAKASLLFYLY